MFKLVIQDDEGKTTVVPLIRDEITIGRKEGNTIRLTERNVSRRHARILRNNGEVHIEDLGSYNGIRVNNARIAERVSLRVSDQVQIGDYKLYLKAEGVEQVDDARTMPIERIDSGLPTEVMPAMQAPATQPMGAATAPTPIPQTPPNRSAAAVADTDPNGRPVASAAQVAAMSQPAGYGKLVVVSKNFAGKEFDLTRPQMIVGRTPENDIVVDHRSISRNHAKVTRDPDTGRYTISDLQSSNGVRVNGQDYGKVELRRGDTVDLGHVRLRFVEPGEDFVFARDAVIADVPEGGSKKGLLVAVLLGILVLGGVGAFFMLNKKQPEVTAGSGDTNGSVGTGPGSEQVAINNGSGEGSEMVVTPTPDATDTVKPPPGDLAGTTKVECQQAQADKNWRELSSCSERLSKFDKDLAKKFGTAARDELANEGRLAEINKAGTDWNKANKALAQIGKDSVYRDEAEQKTKQIHDDVVSLYRDKARAMKDKDECDKIVRLVGEARTAGGADAAEAVAAQKCAPVVANNPPPPTKDCSQKLWDNTTACKKAFCAANGSDPKCSTGTTQVTPPPNCDPDALKDKGMENVNMGQHAAALAQFEASLRCKSDSYVLSLAFMAACNAGNAGKAKQLYGKLSTQLQNKYKVMCIRNHIELP
jgi:pSer/pThr/pTyr-binding forkhead associated (FHA) protein